MPTTLLESNLPGLNLIHRGKVRDVYALSDAELLIVASDRLSAFDVVLPDPIPGKGEMLCQISNFWFGKTAHLVPNHLTGKNITAVLPAGVDADLYARRSVITKRLKPVPVEAIARGYLIGSGWKDYQATGQLCGIALPAGLRQAEQLPQPIFTPSTKAAVGDHDENIGFDRVVALVGADLAEQVRDDLLTYEAPKATSFGTFFGRAFGGTPKISQVVITGTRPYEISIEVSEEKLRKLGLKLSDIARAVRSVSWFCLTPIEAATTSSTLPASRRRIASSTAISSNGFIDIFTFARSTPLPSALTRTFTL